MKSNSTSYSPQVGIVMGSASDLDVMEPARSTLKDFGVPSEFKVLSAHRTPDATLEYARAAATRGLKVLIAGAGGSAHLAGVLAANTLLPVIGVPLQTKSLGGLDSLLSTVQMPGGVPVATVAINGATNAALLALRILAVSSPEIAEKLVRYKNDLESKVLKTKV